MTWSAYIILINVLAKNWCGNLTLQHDVAICAESIVECVLDGEEPEFCMNQYLEEFQNE